MFKKNNGNPEEMIETTMEAENGIEVKVKKTKKSLRQRGHEFAENHPTLCNVAKSVGGFAVTVITVGGSAFLGAFAYDKMMDRKRVYIVKETDQHEEIEYLEEGPTDEPETEVEEEQN